MIFFGVLIGIITIGAMSYLAIDKKSSFKTRIAALGALALMILTLMICIVVILSDNRVPVDPSTLIVGAPVEVQEEGNNLISIVFSIVFLFILFFIIAFLTLREHKRSKGKLSNSK
jgi:ABC-type Mn2+/Zn2+ transport system permease subunit